MVQYFPEKLYVKKHKLANMHFNQFLASVSPQATDHWKKHVFTGQLYRQLVIYSTAQVKAVTMASLLHLIKDLFLQKKMIKKARWGRCILFDQIGEHLVVACSGLTMTERGKQWQRGSGKKKMKNNLGRGGGGWSNRTEQRTEQTQLRVTFFILRDPWLWLGSVLSAGYIISHKFSCSSLLMRWHSNKWGDNLMCWTFIATEE